jgi:hypothetical protein
MEISSDREFYQQRIREYRIAVTVLALATVIFGVAAISFASRSPGHQSLTNDDVSSWCTSSGGIQGFCDGAMTTVGTNIVVFTTNPSQTTCPSFTIPASVHITGGWSTVREATLQYQLITPGKTFPACQAFFVRT